MIETNHLTKWYGPTLAVDDLNLSIDEGQVVGFLGPNGAGKTTTLRMLTGYLPATSGQAIVAGHDVLRESSAARSKIGYMPETTPLYTEMRVVEYLDYRGKLQLMSRADRKKRINMVVDRCGLEGVRKRLIGALSKGNRQRVGLAAALLHDPPVLVLDEPTAGLDPTQITHVRSLIDELRGQHTIIVSTHILPEVERTADRVIIISRGAIVADGTVEELRQQVATGSDLRIDVKAAKESVENAFGRNEYVKDVNVESLKRGWCRALVTPKNGQDIREPLGEIITRNAWVVREMRYNRATLEEYFIQITAEQDQAPGTAGSKD